MSRTEQEFEALRSGNREMAERLKKAENSAAHYLGIAKNITHRLSLALDTNKALAEENTRLREFALNFLCDDPDCEICRGLR